MGLIQGDSIIVMDAFTLPVEGTETSAGPHLITGNGVGFKPDILDMDIMEKVLEVKGEDAVKMAQQFTLWGYHQEPTRWQRLNLQRGPETKGSSSCAGERYLSSALFEGIDVSTQMLNQQFQEPFLAIVIDPTRTVFAGKVDIGAFRTYPKDYKPPDEPVSEYQTIPLNKIEDFGVHCKQYYSLDITYFKSSLDSHLLDLLWNKYSVNTLSSSPLLGNRDYVAGQIFDLADKLEQAEGQLAHSRFGMLMPSQRKKEFDTILDMEKDELALEIEEEEEGEIEYVEGDDIEMGDMDDMEDFEGFGDEDGKHFPCFY
ncbi:COP9 signalosome complex subunit 5b [Hordeum vulgare]|nr:COP9 signalosome complex subunit 5b [Hordeum vulgare]